MGEIKEERLSTELREANISLILDGYNDLFSDFDPRSFSERALSDDFLLECRKAAREKEAGIELIMSVPRDKRSINEEFKIKKRLKEHFKKHAFENEKEMTKIKKEGFFWVVLGVVVLSFILYGFVNFINPFLVSLLTILEVPSWFLMWEGMSKILIESKKIEPDHDFYKKMSAAQITFRSY